MRKIILTAFLLYSLSLAAQKRDTIPAKLLVETVELYMNSGGHPMKVIYGFVIPDGEWYLDSQLDQWLSRDKYLDFWKHEIQTEMVWDARKL